MESVWIIRAFATLIGSVMTVVKTLAPMGVDRVKEEEVVWVHNAYAQV